MSCVVSHGNINPIPPADEHSRNRRGLSTNRGDVLCASLWCTVTALPLYCIKKKKKIKSCCGLAVARESNHFLLSSVNNCWERLFG